MITSKQNDFIKLAASLKTKKARDAHGMYLAEGLRVVRDTLKVNPSARVIVASSKAAELDGAIAGADVTVADDRVFEKLTDTKTSQGVVAVCPIPKFDRAYESPLCLYLDGISDPGNLGTILRTALAAGFNEVYLGEGCADVFNPKCVRSAMSAAAKVKTFAADVTELDRLRAFGYTLLSADMDGESVFETAFTAKKYCLMIGGEARGLSDAARAQADAVVSVPMQGDIESLNAAVSAGILMYGIYAKRNSF